jgi:murein DD-endopeptidase MepM/ murein hydrolase activator NlpD
MIKLLNTSAAMLVVGALLSSSPASAHGNIVNQEKSLVRRMDDRKKKDRKLSHRVSRLAKKAVRRSSGSSRAKARKTDATFTAPTDAGSLAFWRQRGHLPWPVDSRKVTMHYGLQTYMAGESGLKFNNLSLSIAAEKDAPVKAVSDGVVDEIMDLGDGVAVLVQHGKYFTIYSDLSAGAVTKGQQVSAGDILGQVGETGQVDFRIYDDHGVWLDPEKWLAK